MKLESETKYYKSMRQPELGKKLQELRQSKGMTQQEISEACNVSMRTIQRIELGKAHPRQITLKLILDELGEDYESFVEAENVVNYDKNVLKIAAFSGIIYFLLGIPEAYLDLQLFEGIVPSKIFYITIKLLVIVSLSLFINGFALLGKQLHLKSLVFTSYAMIIMSATFYFVWIGLILFEVDGTILAIAESIAMGTIAIFFGMSLYKLRPVFGDVVLGLVVLEVFLGICLLFVFSAFLGLLLCIPATIIEIYLLYVATEKVATKDLSFS